ncbi:hypothetical protein GGI02_005603, partial [Coemansia sp. RSA 2322]
MRPTSLALASSFLDDSSWKDADDDEAGDADDADDDAGDADVDADDASDAGGMMIV